MGRRRLARPSDLLAAACQAAQARSDGHTALCVTLRRTCIGMAPPDCPRRPPLPRRPTPRRWAALAAASPAAGAGRCAGPQCAGPGSLPSPCPARTGSGARILRAPNHHQRMGRAAPHCAAVHAQQRRSAPGSIAAPPASTTFCTASARTSTAARLSDRSTASWTLSPSSAPAREAAHGRAPPQHAPACKQHIGAACSIRWSHLRGAGRSACACSGRRGARPRAGTAQRGVA